MLLKKIYLYPYELCENIISLLLLCVTSTSLYVCFTEASTLMKLIHFQASTFTHPLRSKKTKYELSANSLKLVIQLFLSRCLKNTQTTLLNPSNLDLNQCAAGPMHRPLPHRSDQPGGPVYKVWKLLAETSYSLTLLSPLYLH